MRVLLLHPNFPAQLRHVAKALGESGEHTVVFATKTPRHGWVIPGVSKALYVPQKGASTQGKSVVTRLVDPFRDAVAQGEAFYRLGQMLKDGGFTPDVIYANSGWGSTLYIKDIWPDTPLQCYFEWFYDPQGKDSSFDKPKLAEGPPLPPKVLRTRNASIFNDLWMCDQGISPTRWQKSQFPQEYQDKIAVLHDGVDTEFFSPQPDAKMVLPSLDLSHVEEVITYVGRGMEPYRGFPQFMEAMEIVLRRRPKAHVVIAGSERVCYGAPHPSGKSYKDVMLEQLDLPEERIHFVGSLPYAEYRKLLAASSVHVYLTRPFVLSWSAIEAMASGCCIVASDTDPVREAMQDGESALLVDFFDAQAIAARVEEALGDKALQRRISQGARRVAEESYSLRRLLPRHIELLKRTALGG